MADAQNILILIVEDEPLILLIACDALEAAGIAFVAAANAEEALKVLHGRTDVGLLFTDINMPGSLDGLDLAELVHSRWPNIKLVLTSGRPLERPVPGHGLFLPKPYAPEAISQVINQALEGPMDSA